MKIESGKFYKTANGLKAKVIELDDVVFGQVNDWGGPPKTRTATIWNLDGTHLVPEYRLHAPWIYPVSDFDFDWSCLAAWSKFVAMDESGTWYSHHERPDPDDAEGTWAVNSWLHDEIPKEFAPKNYTGDWKDSLRENPNPRKYIKP